MYAVKDRPWLRPHAWGGRSSCERQRQLISVNKQADLEDDDDGDSAGLQVKRGDYVISNKSVYQSMVPTMTVIHRHFSIWDEKLTTVDSLPQCCS